MHLPSADASGVCGAVNALVFANKGDHHLPERYGPPTTVYNRFNRWRKAGVWNRLMDAIIAAHDGKVQMIDSSVVRVHQQAAAQKNRLEILVSVEVEED